MESELSKIEKYIEAKEKLDSITKSDMNEEQKEEKIEDYKYTIEIYKNYYTKYIIHKNNYLYYSDKYEIFNEIKNESDISLVRMDSEDEILVNPETHFGIWGNHRYDFIKCIKKDENLFFHLWNPHGNNPDENNNIYNSEFKDINKINSDGINNGNIILSFDRFILPFERIAYQNKKDIKKMYNKFKTQGAFDAIYIVHKYFFIQMFGHNYEIWLTLIWLKIYHSKGKDIKTIFFDLMKEIDSKIEISIDQLLWFLYIWNALKKEIIKESEDIMNKKMNNIGEIDSEKIKDILYEENEKANIYLIHIVKSQNSFIKERLTEIREELEPFIKNLIEKHTEGKKRRQREEEERKRRQREEEEEEERRRRRQREYEEEERRRRQREEEKRRRESRQYES